MWFLTSEKGEISSANYLGFDDQLSDKSLICSRNSKVPGIDP